MSRAQDARILARYRDETDPKTIRALRRVCARRGFYPGRLHDLLLEIDCEIQPKSKSYQRRRRKFIRQKADAHDWNDEVPF